MAFYRVHCDNCGHTRIGRIKNGEVEPFLTPCPECGETDVQVPAED